MANVKAEGRKEVIHTFTAEEEVAGGKVEIKYEEEALGIDKGIEGLVGMKEDGEEVKVQVEEVQEEVAGKSIGDGEVKVEMEEETVVETRRVDGEVKIDLEVE